MEDSSAPTPAKSRFLRYPFSPRNSFNEDESVQLSQSEGTASNSIWRSPIRKGCSVLRGNKLSAAQPRVNKDARADKDAGVVQASPQSKFRLIPRASAKIAEALSRFRGAQARRFRDSLEDRLPQNPTNNTHKQNREDDLGRNYMVEYSEEPEEFSHLSHSTSASLQSSEEGSDVTRKEDHPELHCSLETAPEFFTPRMFTLLPPIEESKTESFHSLDDLLEAETPQSADSGSEAPEVQDSPTQSGAVAGVPQPSDREPGGTESPEAALHSELESGAYSTGSGCPTRLAGDSAHLHGEKAFLDNNENMLASLDRPAPPHSHLRAPGEGRGALPSETHCKEHSGSTPGSATGTCGKDGKILDTKLDDRPSLEAICVLPLQPVDCKPCSNASDTTASSGDSTMKEGNGVTQTPRPLDSASDEAESERPDSGPEVEEAGMEPEAVACLSKASTSCCTPSLSSADRSVSIKNFWAERDDPGSGAPEQPTGRACEPEDPQRTDSIDSLATKAWAWMVSGVVTLLDALLKTEGGLKEQATS